MNSYKDDKGRWWVACHECEYGGNGFAKSCETGKYTTINELNRGCPGGVIISKLLENEKETY